MCAVRTRKKVASLPFIAFLSCGRSLHQFTQILILGCQACLKPIYIYLSRLLVSSSPKVFYLCWSRLRLLPLIGFWSLSSAFRLSSWSVTIIWKIGIGPRDQFSNMKCSHKMPAISSWDYDVKPRLKSHGASVILFFHSIPQWNENLKKAITWIYVHRW